MLTAYDYSFAAMIEAAGIEVTLVGDSQMLYKADTTIPVTVDEMAYHTAAVKRAIKNSC